MANDSTRTARRDASAEPTLVRFLVVSADPDRVLLVRRAMRSWPRETRYRVATSAGDAVAVVDAYAPHVVFWDERLDAPTQRLGRPVVLLGEEKAGMLGTDVGQGAGQWITPRVIFALLHSLNREYERAALRGEHGSGSTSLGPELGSTLLPGTRSVGPVASHAPAEARVDSEPVEAAEAEADRRLQRYFEESRDPVVVLDADGVACFANHAARVLLEDRIDPILGRVIELPPGAQYGQVIAYPLASGAALRTRIDRWPTRWAGARASLLCFRVEGSDDSRLRMDDRIDLHRAASVGQLALGLTHELRNPASFVAANIDGLRHHHHTLGLFVDRLEQLVEDEAYVPTSRVMALVDEFGVRDALSDAIEMTLDCSKGMERIREIVRSAGTFEVTGGAEEPEPLDLERIIDDSCALVYNLARYRAPLIKRFDPVGSLTGYRARIGQALVNVLLNAVESIEPGRYEDNQILVSLTSSDDEVVIAVSDTGVTPSDADLGRVLEDEVRRVPNGSVDGRMLHLCDEILREHGGRLETRQNEGPGMTLRLVLPQHTGLVASVDAQAEAPFTSAFAGPPTTPTRRLRVLVVDDDAMVLASLRRQLKNYVDVVTAAGGAQGLERLRDDARFDAVVSDLMMPEMDGKLFYEKVTEHFPRLATKMIFLSGGAFTPRLKRFAESVADRLLDKPVLKEDLVSMLTTVVER